jgi:DnaJ like chaperone protein
MIPVGKIIFVLLGFSMAKMHGVLLGLIVGHALDVFLTLRLKQITEERAAKEAAEAQTTAVFEFIYFLGGKLVGGALGANSTYPIDTLAARHGISAAGLATARSRFNEARSSQITAFDVAVQLSHIIPPGHPFRNQIVNALDELLRQNRGTSTNLRTLGTIAHILGVGEFEEGTGHNGSSSHNAGHNGQHAHTNGEHQHSSKTAPRKADQLSAYEILGCTPGTPIKDVKKKYRQLISELHPDKLLSKDLPPEAMNVITNRFRAIQEAYETIAGAGNS